MPNFLASVGYAELFENIEGVLRPFATAKSLTDSSISFTSTSEEIRQGEGAKLTGKFFGSSGMTVKLTDVMFDLKYIAAQVGKQISRKGYDKIVDPGAIFIVKKDEVSGNNKVKLKVSKTPYPLGTSCGLNDHIIVWYKKVDCNDKRMYAAEIKPDYDGNYIRSDNGEFAGIVINPEGQITDNYCIYTMQEAKSAKTLLVGADCNPQELVLIITTGLYAGDYAAPECGAKVGRITMKIPRFQLDGQFDLSSSMSSATPVAINGTALYQEENCKDNCNSKGVFAEITEVLQEPEEEYFELIIEDLNQLKDIKNWEIGNEIEVYVKYENGEISQVDPGDLTWGGAVWGEQSTDETLVDYEGVIRKKPIYNGLLTITYKGKEFTYKLVGGADNGSIE